MNKIFKYGIALPCCSLLLSGCDDGKIYPDDSIDAGRTVTIQVSFTGVRAYPDYNMLTFAAFGEDAHEPLLTQRLSRPTEGHKKNNESRVKGHSLRSALIIIVLFLC